MKLQFTHDSLIEIYYYIKNILQKKKIRIINYNL